MTRRKYIEVSCDYCSSAIEYLTPGGNTDAEIRSIGGVVSKHGDFCDKDCRDSFVWEQQTAPKCKTCKDKREISTLYNNETLASE